MLRLPALVVLAAFVSGCDFTPALDIETPPHEARTTLRGVLVADSVAVVRVTRSADPFAGVPDGQTPTASDAVVTLRRDGGPPETLVLRPDTCARGQSSYNPETGETTLIGPYECGAFVGAVPLVAGETYVVRAEAPGLPPAEATVTVPTRPDLTADDTTPGPDGPRRLSVWFQDPPGPGDTYHVEALSPLGGFSSSGCVNGVCTDTSGVNVLDGLSPIALTTADPALVAVDGLPDANGRSSYVFSDEVFDGQPRTVRFEAGTRDAIAAEVADAPLTVRLAALSPALYEAYRQSRATAINRDIPFAEPVSPVSNVVGGYGFVGAAAVAEVRLPGRSR